MQRSIQERNDLASAHWRLVYHVAHTCLRACPGVRALFSAEELASEGATGLLRAAEVFDDSRAPPFAALAVVCIKRAIWTAVSRERVRRARLRMVALPDDELLGSNQEDVAGLGDVVPLDSLNERQQQAITMRFWRGHSFQEIGQELGVTHQRAEQVIAAGLEKLRQALV